MTTHEGGRTMTPEQIAGLEALLRRAELPTDCDCDDDDCLRCAHYPTLKEQAKKELIALAPTLARHVLTQQAQIERLSKALNSIASMTNLDDPDSYASDTPSDCVEVVHQVANFALKGGDA